MKFPVYFRLTSQVKKNVVYVVIDNEENYEETMSDIDFLPCNPVQLKNKPRKDIININGVELEEFRYDNDLMWDKFSIPVYAIDRINNMVSEKNGCEHKYDIPESQALDFYRKDLELASEDVSLINCFIEKLNGFMPDGYDIDWDVESCKSPFFDRYPEFGKGCECVYLRVYPKNTVNLLDYSVSGRLEFYIEQNSRYGK